MDSIINSISTREWASSIWLGAFVFWLILYKPMRASLAQLLKSFFKPVLIIPLAIAAAYAAGEIYLLYRVGWWSVANLKTTILWLATFAFVTMFEVATSKSRKASLSKITSDIVTVTSALVFITELYSFSLTVELIALPLATVVALMAEMAKQKPEHASAARLFGLISALIGLSYLGSSIWKSIEVGREAATWAVALEFLIPVVLSVGFLPFLYAWRAYVAYSDVFATISVFGIDKSLVPYARWLALTHVRCDLELLHRWRKSIRSSHPSSKAELKHSLIALRAREATPPIVQPEDGWSPYLAMQFMAECGVDTGYYHRSFDDKWLASSPMREIGDGLGFKNNLAYYLDGTEHAVTAVKIKLNVNDPATAGEAEYLFILHSMHLLEQAVSFNAVNRLKLQIASLKSFTAEVPFGSVTLSIEAFGGGINGGYLRKFEIERGQR